MMERVDLPVKGRTVIDVEINTERQLDEVVVVGYGMAKRSDITGSTTGLNMKNINQDNLVSLESALKGRVSGVRVLSDNSPGGSITSGMAIYDTMRFVKSPIKTICVGMAASMASVLLTM